MLKKFANLTVFTALFAFYSVAEAQQAVFLVRHGDTVRQKGNPDVPLAEPGERRAQALAALLKGSGINVIYTTGLQRTVKTAEPLAKQLGIEPRLRPQLRPSSKSDGADEFAHFLRVEHRQDIVLAVLHSRWRWSRRGYTGQPVFNILEGHFKVWVVSLNHLASRRPQLSVPALLKALGHATPIKIPESEFDNLFVVVPRPEGEPTVLRLRY